MTPSRALSVLIAVAVCIVACPAELRAQQQSKLPRIGVLWPGDVESYNNAFFSGLRDQGYVRGKTVAIDVRRTNGNFESGRALAEELIALDPDVIFAAPGPLAKYALHAIRNSDKRIPLVVLAHDPVAEGLVGIAARPDTNTTGVGDQDPELVTKLLQVLKETVPRVSRVTYLEDWISGPGRSFMLKARAALERGGREIGVQISPFELRSPEDIENAFAEAVQQRADGLIVTATPLVLTHRGRIIALAEKYHLPAVYGDEVFAYAGGFISYWTSIADMHARAAGLVAKILRGANPENLPVEYPTRYRLVINLQTAKSLGLMVPQSVLLQADDLIN